MGLLASSSQSPGAGLLTKSAPNTPSPAKPVAAALPSKPQPLLQQSITAGSTPAVDTAAPNVFSGAAKFGKDVVKGIVDTELHPSEEQQNYEKQAFPTPKNPINRVITAPIRTAGKAVTRFLNPGLQPFSKDVAGAYEGNAHPETFTALHTQAQQGDPDAQKTLTDLGLLTTHGAKGQAGKIVGDTIQAVLTAYMPELGGKLAAESTEQGFKQAVTHGLLSGAKTGAVFGGAQALSNQDADPVHILKTVATNTAGGGLLGGIISGAIPAAAHVVDAAKKAQAHLEANPPEAAAPAETPGLLRNPGESTADHYTRQTPNLPEEPAVTKFKTGKDAPEDLSTTVLERLKGRDSVSKQFISDLTNAPDLKQPERELIRSMLESEGDKVNVPEFVNKVKSELLPVSRDTVKNPKYESVNLSDDQRGKVADYNEHIYSSPIKTKAGDVHFGKDAPNYFGHTRTEDLPPEKIQDALRVDKRIPYGKDELAGGDTRRVVELQSDLFQKGNLEKEKNLMEKSTNEVLAMPNEEIKARQKEVSKLEPHRNTWHERLVREEIKKAAEDGKTKVQFPTGETAMKIEGLGNSSRWLHSRESSTALGEKVTPENLKIGDTVYDANRSSEDWVVTDVHDDGKFIAIPKRQADMAVQDLGGSIQELAESGDLNDYPLDPETFDASGKADSENPIYKFYEKEVGKYLKNKYGAERVTDKQGVSWWEVKVKPEHGTEPVTAFKQGKESSFDLPVKEAEHLFRQMFSDREVDFFARDKIDVTEEHKGTLHGAFTPGSVFKNPMVQLLERDGRVESSTLYHESFHAYLEMFVSKSEKAQLLKNISKNIAAKPGQLGKIIEGYEGKDLRAEEWAADDFANYVAGKNFIKANETFYQKILRIIREWIRKATGLKDVYDRALSADRSYKKPTSRKLEVIPSFYKLGKPEHEGEDLPRNEEEFYKLPSDAQENVFPHLSSDLQNRINGVDVASFDKSPTQRMVDDIVAGKVKMRVPDSIKTEAKDALGKHYMRFFRKSATLRSLDEVTEELRSQGEDVTESSLLESIRKQVDLNAAKRQDTRNTTAMSAKPSKLNGATQTDIPEPGKTEEQSKSPLSNPTQTAPTPELSPKESSLLRDTTEMANTQVNVNHLNISDEGKKLIEQTVAEIKPQLEKSVGKVLSNKEAIDLADRSSKVLTKVIDRESTLQWEAALLHARQDMARAAESGRVDADYIANLKVVKTMGTDIGRKLQSFSIGADPKERISMHSIVDAVLKTQESVDDILKAAEGVDFNNLEEATNFYRKFVKPNASEWIDLVRYNSMLSSPNTHIINTFSNSINTIMVAPMEKAITGGLDFLSSSVTGHDRQYYAGESGAYLKNYFTNVREASTRFTEVMTGKREYRNLEPSHLPPAREGIKGKVALTLDYPMRLLEASDQFFTALAESGERAALTYRAGKGVKVGNIPELAERNAAYQLFRAQLFDERQGNVLDAMDSITATLQGWRSNKNPLLSTVAKFTIPFLRTPMNIAKQGIEYSPAGFTTLYGASNKTEQLAKAITGTAVFAGASMLLASNRLTWAEPANQTDKNAFRSAGKQAYSIKIGEHWYSYQKLPPALAFPLVMVAGINDTIENGKMDEDTATKVLDSIAKFGKFFADQSYVKSMGDLLATASGDATAASRLVSNYPQQLVPFRALSSWFARLADPVQRTVDTKANFVEKQVQELMLSIPGLTQKLPARTDASGNPIEQPNRFENAVSPVRVTTENPEKASQYSGMQDIKKLNQHQSTLSAERTDAASKEWEKIKALGSPEEKKAYLKNIASTDPQLAKKIITVAKQDSLELNAEEVRLSNAAIPARAQYIAQKLATFPDSESKKSYLKDLAEKKILTQDVLTQLAPLVSSQP